MKTDNRGSKVFELASIEKLKSLEYREFIKVLYDLAVTCGLDIRFNLFKIWGYPWLWFSGLKDINWAGKRVVCIRTESSPFPWLIAKHGAKVTLIDIDSRWLNTWIQARNVLKVDVDWCIEGSERIPFDNKTIDAVISYSALSRQLLRKVAVDEVVRILKPGGLFAVSVEICETELGMSFEEYNGKWNGKALSIKEFEKLIWQHPSFDLNGKELYWNYEDCREFINWTKQIEQNNFVVGAALLHKLRSVERKTQETKKPKPIFFHIPKTAGETFNTMLKSLFSNQALFGLNPSDVTRSFRVLRTIELEEPDKIHVITGHACFGFSRNLPNEYVYFTLLRNPVDRVLSYLDFVYCSPDHPLHNTLRNNPNIEFSSGPFVNEICNLQTRMIAGYYDFIISDNQEVLEARLKVAKRNLDNFAVVGITEEFDTFVKLVNWKFGWQLSKIPKQNVTADLMYRANPDPQLIEKIKEYNQLDIELYEFAKNLFHRQVEETGIEMSIPDKEVKSVNIPAPVRISKEIITDVLRIDAQITTKQIFVHIPKTAGETINRMLAASFGDKLYWLDHQNLEHSLSDLQIIEFSTPDRISCISGHIFYGIHHNLPNQYTYFTLLRNPAERVLSFLDYVYCTPDHPLHANLRNNSTVDFLSESYVNELCDLQTRMLSGFYKSELKGIFTSKSRLEIAKQNLQKFAVVGITEEFDTFVKLVNWKFGWQLSKIPKQNVTADLMYRANPDPQLIEKIKEYNQLDIELYEFAKNLFHRQVEEIK